MKRKTIVKAHIAATIVAVFTIATFFTFSLIAEIRGNEDFIRKVKETILFSLPLMLFAMPILNITGNKLVGNSQNPIVLAKKKRMKLVLIIGIGLISLAIFLYYRSHYQRIDSVFFTAQIIEFVLGLTNLTLIGLNGKNGFQLSRRLKQKSVK